MVKARACATVNNTTSTDDSIHSEQHNAIKLGDILHNDVSAPSALNAVAVVENAEALVNHAANSASSVP